MALALAGTVDFDPLSDTLTNNKGEEVSLSVPVGIELPPEGFDPGKIPSSLPQPTDQPFK